jgi:TldD protein
MPTTRRNFLAVSGAVSAGLLLPGRAFAAMPPGARRPAPDGAPPTADATTSALDGSRLLTDERLAKLAVERAQKGGATYADARLVLWRRERVGVRDDHISDVSRTEDYGIGVRVIVDGGWGFAATNVLDRRSVTAVAKQAVETAKINAKLLREVGGDPVELAPTPAVQGKWVSSFEVDPFTIPIGDKAELLLEATRGLLAVPGVRFGRGRLYAVREEKLLVTSEGSRIHQLYFRTVPGLTATAVDGKRGRFASRGHEASPMLAGWEYIDGLDLPASARAIGEEAVQKLHAHSVEPGKRQVILAPSNLWLTIHENIGHPTELDRSMGFEADFAGTSFIRPDDAGKLQIGSDIVDLIADRTQPGGLATTGWDDEGVPAQRWPMVENGKFVGWQTTRDQVAWIGAKASLGCSYANGFGNFQFQRMPNISLQPGPEGYSTEDLINATDDGILITGQGSWSIDHQRYNFQFGGQFFWEIKNGRLKRPLRDVAYQSNTTEFWTSCDMLGGEGTYRLGGSFGDGKGQPGQSNSVSHGCPPARFEVNIVNTGEDK